MSRIIKCQIIFLCILFMFDPKSNLSQTGGTFEITHSVIASGGGQQSTGGTFSIDGTIGQSLASGFLQNLPFFAYNGFWTPEVFAPTAASVSVSGRVSTAEGHGIRNAYVTITDARGTSRTSRTGKFGMYLIANVAPGETYIIGVSARRFTFSQPVQIRMVTEDLTGLDFTANDRALTLSK